MKKLENLLPIFAKNPTYYFRFFKKIGSSVFVENCKIISIDADLRRFYFSKKLKITAQLCDRNKNRLITFPAHQSFLRKIMRFRR